jgi:DNA invertase Pin-like site-specific DNA recombinase
VALRSVCPVGEASRVGLEEFQSLGIGFVSHQEALNTSTPMGEAMFTIISAMAELERNVIRERVRSGIAHAKAKGTRSGKSIGRPKRVFRRDEALRLRKEGASWRRVAALLLGLPVSTVVDACRTPAIRRTLPSR